MDLSYQSNEKLYMKLIKDKCRFHYLGEQGEELIESILWQNDIIKEENQNIKKIICHIARVAGSYTKSIDALKMIDSAMPKYIERRTSSPRFQTGNLLGLRIRKKGSLISKLKKDIENDLLAIPAWKNRDYSFVE